MAKKQAVKNDVVEDVADVVAKEQTVESSFPYAGLMFDEADMTSLTNVVNPETGERLTLAEFIGKAEDSRVAMALALGIYRSTKDESKIAEFIGQRDAAITEARKNPANLPAAVVETIVTATEKAFNAQINKISAGEDNAIAALHFVRTGNVPGNKATRHGALPDWTSDHSVMLHSTKTSDYLLVKAGKLAKGKCPEKTAFDSPDDWCIFRLRGGTVSKVTESEIPTKSLDTTGMGFEYAGTVSPPAPQTPSGINKAIQTLLKGTEMSVNGWQGLYVPHFTKSPDFLK